MVVKRDAKYVFTRLPRYCGGGHEWSDRFTTWAWRPNPGLWYRVCTKCRPETPHPANVSESETA